MWIIKNKALVAYRPLGSLFLIIRLPSVFIYYIMIWCRHILLLFLDFLTTSINKFIRLKNDNATQAQDENQTDSRFLFQNRILLSSVSIKLCLECMTPNLTEHSIPVKRYYNPFLVNALLVWRRYETVC